MGSCLFFCLIFKFSDMFFCVVFRIAFLMHFLPKICQNWPQKMLHLTSLFRPFSRLWSFVVFLLISGSLLAPLWHPLGSCRCPRGSICYPFGSIWACFFLLFFNLWVSVWSLLGKNHLFSAEIHKKHSCTDPGIKFLANCRMQPIFPRPRDGTIAAGNRDRCPKKGWLQDAPAQCGGVLLLARLWSKLSLQGSILGSFWSHVPLIMWSKIDPEIDTEQKH